MAEGPKPRFDRTVEIVRGVRDFITAAVTILAALLLTVVVMNLLREDVVLVDKIEIAPSAAKTVEASPTAVADWLLDQMAAIRVETRKQERDQAGIARTSDEPDNLELPGTDVPIRSAIRLLRDYGGHPEQHITGQLFVKDGKLALQLRLFSTKGSEDIGVDAADLDTLMKRAATEIMIRTDPVVAATSFYGEEPERAEELVRKILNKADVTATIKAEAHNLWGMILLERWRKSVARSSGTETLDEAIDHLTRATQIDPKFATAWANLGLARRDAADYWRRRDPARAGTERTRGEEAFHSAVAHQSDLAQAYYGLGLMTRDRCISPSNHCCDVATAASAAATLRHAAELGPGQHERWFELGRTLLWSHAPDVDGALDAFSRAIEVRPSSPHFCWMLYALRSAWADGCFAGAARRGAPAAIYRDAARVLRRKARVVSQLRPRATKPADAAVDGVAGPTPPSKRTVHRTSLALAREHNARLSDQCAEQPPGAMEALRRRMARTERARYCARTTRSTIDGFGVTCGMTFAAGRSEPFVAER
jgi:tetratricopeptide (TPR) repeat protein